MNRQATEENTVAFMLNSLKMNGLDLLISANPFFYDNPDSSNDYTQNYSSKQNVRVQLIRGWENKLLVEKVNPIKADIFWILDLIFFKVIFCFISNILTGCEADAKIHI